MFPFWSNRIRHIIFMPHVFLLKWGIKGWRLTIYIACIGCLILCCIYILSSGLLSSIGSNVYEYSSLYCFTPGPVIGEEGLLKSSRGHLYNLVQVQTVVRHGDRAPIDTSAIPNVPPVKINCFFNETKSSFSHKLAKFKKATKVFTVKGGDHPVSNEAETCAGGQLSPYGFIQHIFNGEHMKRAYASLFKDAYTYKNVVIYSTDYDRTVQSASALLYGIFKDSFDITDHSFTINVIKAKEKDSDFLLDQEGKLLECPNFQSEIIKMRESLEMRAVNSVANLQVERYADLFKTDLSQMPHLSRIVDTIVTRLCHNQGLPMGAKGTISREIVDASFQLSHRHITAEHKPVSEIQSTALLSKIVQYIAKLYNGKETQRLVLYSGHDSTLAPLLINLGASDGKWPPYASKITFEVWELQSSSDNPSNVVSETMVHKIRNSFIRVLYNGKVITDKIRFCKNVVDGELCSTEDLFSYVSLGEVDSGNYFKRIIKLCNS